MRHIIENTGSRQKKRRNYFPFDGGMRGQLFAGVGANYQLNMATSSGFLFKLKRGELRKDAGIDNISFCYPHEKADGTFQILLFGEVSGDFKLRALEEDGTITTPSSGVGDLIFSGDISARQFGTTSIICHDAGSHDWDGTTLTANTGSLDIVSAARDGSRLSYITATGDAKFTDNAPVGGFTGGTGANADGEYNTSIAYPKAVVEGGVGVVIFGEDGAEAHWVQPNNASDEVSTRTKIESFTYRGRGVTTAKHVISTGQSIVFMNEDGVFEMNPFSGKTSNLIEGGKIERYWDEQVTITGGFMAYDPDNDVVLASVAVDSPQRNTFIGFSLRQKNRDPFFLDAAYYNHSCIAKGQLVGVSSRDAKVYNLFNKFSTAESATVKARYITETDGLGSPQEEKTFYGATAVVVAAPESSLKMRVYKDGSTTPFIEKTYTTTDLTITTGGAAYGEYQLAVGAADLIGEPVIRGEHKKGSGRFKTLAVEILEDSSDKFEIHDIIIEYKKAGRLAKSLAIKNNLF